MRAGASILVGLFLIALLGPLVFDSSPLAQDRETVLAPPSLRSETGATVHLLGTDGLGRDVLVRSLHAARYTLATAFCGVALSLVLGTGVGIVAGLLGGLWDRTLMRATELVMALPALYLILGLRNLFPDRVSRLESGVIVVLSLSAVGWSGIARLVRGQVLSIREQDYVAAAVAAGATRWQLLKDHLLPVLRPFLLLQLGLYLPYFFLGEVTLSFLGLGLPEPEPSFGSMLAGALSTVGLLGRYWWTWVAPAAFLTLAVLGANLWLEGLRERYIGDSGSELDRGFASWATRASRLWSSSTWGSKHLRHRAS